MMFHDFFNYFFFESYLKVEIMKWDVLKSQTLWTLSKLSKLDSCKGPKGVPACILTKVKSLKFKSSVHNWRWLNLRFFHFGSNLQRKGAKSLSLALCTKGKVLRRVILYICLEIWAKVKSFLRLSHLYHTW